MLYEKKYVKKRKRRIAAAFIFATSSIATGALVTIAFLGRYTGTFTVTLDEKHVNLSLSQTEDFKEATTVLTVNQLPAYHEYTYQSILAKQARIDNEETDYLDGATFATDEDETNRVNPLSLDYFKYTFYVKNTGTVTARYNFVVNILENTPDTETGTRYLDNVLRVAIYENDPGSERGEPKVYAKESTIYKDLGDGNGTYQEYIAASKERASEDNPYYGFAEKFESADRITTLRVADFKQDQIKRYTVITWLEGEDPESDHRKEAPKGAKIKIGVEINAYENE
jgi:hypothetical protein